MKNHKLELTREFIQKLPKAELHCHLDGSLRVSSIIEIAAAEGVTLPTTDPIELKNILAVGLECPSLEVYLQSFDITCSVLQTKGALQRAVFELAEDCAAENVRYLEIRFAPILHTKKGLKLVEVIAAVLKGKEQAERDFNIKLGIIICSLRHNDPEESLIAAELAVAFKNKGIVGFDLAGAEKDFPARNHKDAFDLIIKNNISSPFIQSINSPIFLVECKNWTNPVGVEEARVFESKIRELGKRANLGIFVALNGVTPPFKKHINNLKRENYTILVITNREIEELTTSYNLDANEWIESIISNQMILRE